MDNLKARRIQQEVKTIAHEKDFYYQVIQDDKDIHTFYYVIRGNDDSDYEGGYYLGKIVLPPDYPTKNPAFYMLTPSGRFEINKLICLTNSNFHSENNYQSSTWSITKMIIGMCSIFDNDETSGIAHLRKTSDVRKSLAKKSIQYNFDHYPDIFKKFDNYFNQDGSMRTSINDVKEYINNFYSERKKRLEEKRIAKKNKLKIKRNEKNNINDNNNCNDNNNDNDNKDNDKDNCDGNGDGDNKIDTNLNKINNDNNDNDNKDNDKDNCDGNGNGDGDNKIDTNLNKINNDNNKINTNHDNDNNDDNDNKKEKSDKKEKKEKKEKTEKKDKKVKKEKSDKKEKKEKSEKKDKSDKKEKKDKSEKKDKNDKSEKRKKIE
jgi:ubiquitin-protein ligase